MELGRLNKYSALHFQDLICGFFSLNPISVDQSANFSRVLADFLYSPGARTLQKHQGRNFFVVTDSLLEDSETKDGTFSCFVGHAAGLTDIHTPRRKIASHFLASHEWDSDLVGCFLDSRYSGVLIGPNFCRLVTDYYGKKKLFFKQVGDALFFSNEFRNLCCIEDPAESLDRQALRDLLSFGAVIGDRTLSSTIKSVPLQHFIHFDSHGIQALAWRRRDEPRPHESSCEEIHQALKRVFSYYHDDLGLYHADLTGGCDTRLNLAMAKDLGRNLSYNFDSGLSSQEPAVFYDHEVIKILRRQFKLDLQEDLSGPFRSNRAMAKTKFDYHRQFDGDMYSRTLSGMFGGEFFGGWSFENFHGPEHRRRLREVEEELHKAEGGFWRDTISPLDHFSRWCDGLSFADKAFLGSLYLTYSAAAFDRLENPVWLEPYYLSNRKFSCFLADEIIRRMDHHAVSGRVTGYSFYGKFYKECLPDFLQFPFFSKIAEALEDPKLDIRNTVTCPWSGAVAENVLSVQDRVGRKIEFLGKWADQTAFASVFARETRPLRSSTLREARV